MTFLLGDFNIYLSNYEVSDSIKNFIDTLSSNFLLPFYLQGFLRHLR